MFGFVAKTTDDVQEEKRRLILATLDGLKLFVNDLFKFGPDKVLATIGPVTAAEEVAFNRLVSDLHVSRRIFQSYRGVPMS